MGHARGVNKKNESSGEAWKERPSAPSKGVGDTVEKIIHRVSGGRVKSCGGCKKRRDALNKLLPYKPCRKCNKKENPPPQT